MTDLDAPRPLTAGWNCTVCGAHVDIGEPCVWRCPNATEQDRHHALRLVQSIAPLRPNGEDNPFLAYRRYLAWDGFAESLGMDDDARGLMVARLDAAVASVAGTGFSSTPFGRANDLSIALGFSADGGIWVKDETHNVGGSHKARHLFTILLHLLAAEAQGVAPWNDTAGRPPLAIASCGNAAIAASTLAAAVDWPIEVFVPTTASPMVSEMLRGLRADVVVCRRSSADPPGDPCVHRFREAVAHGAVPFSVQGTENAWCLDGGRTIGWEMARHMEEDVEGPSFDRSFIQVGGGAFASCVAAGFRMSGATPRLHAVQTEACAPLARAWRQCDEIGGPKQAAANWSSCMWPWEHVGESAADGILDDETYDWLPIIGAMADGHGTPIVVEEHHVIEANLLGRAHTSIDVSPTGSAGLAGVLAARDELGPDERIAVIFSGIRR